ncbi:hypothetical protein HLH36_06855 [Gluconacetobacter aggeris]|uniref:Uncharacterized protein n=1 Tax=Gluconacetobacter aggeris TaxID=1286186 RepID=A0A7W4NYX8_9PROT|nr:hypothetical protein [Gluconacetobacter aggeris]MBB2168075.1 hypothetical protein [Gluconacetobacter aggeris]
MSIGRDNVLLAHQAAQETVRRQTDLNLQPVEGDRDLDNLICEAAPRARPRKGFRH